MFRFLVNVSIFFQSWSWRFLHSTTSRHQSSRQVPKFSQFSYRFPCNAIIFPLPSIYLPGSYSHTASVTPPRAAYPVFTRVTVQFRFDNYSVHMFGAIGTNELRRTWIFDPDSRAAWRDITWRQHLYTHYLIWDNHLCTYHTFSSHHNTSILAVHTHTLDFYKAFDSVRHSALASKLAILHLPACVHN